MTARRLLRDLWYGPDRPTEDFHDSSVLADIIVASTIQNGSAVSYRWTVAAVYRGVQILSDLAAQLPWHAYEGGDNSGARANDRPERLDLNPAVLVRPDPFFSRADFIRQTVLSLLWRGNAYLFKVGRDSNGLPSAVRVLDPDRMSVRWNDTQTRLLYEYAGRKLSSDSVDHLALNRLPGQEKGVGPLDAGDDAIRGLIAANKFAADLFTNDGIPSGKLTAPSKLTGPEADRLLEAWQKGQEAGRKTAVLSGGMDYETISMTPEQAQNLQSRAYSVADIARLLGIPAHLLNAPTGVAGASGSSLTYQNVMQVNAELSKLTLHPVYLSRIEEAASAWLPRGQSVRFDLTDLTRADESARYAAHETALRAKFLTVDEVRAREGLEPSPELAAEAEAGRQLAESIAAGGDTSEVETETEDEEAEEGADA